MALQPAPRVADVAFRLALGWVGSAAAFVAVVGGIAGTAQSWGRAEYAGLDLRPPETHSLGLHVLAMLALAVLAVGGAAPLVSSRRTWPIGGLVLVGVAAGPMTICAAPVSPAFLTPPTAVTGALDTWLSTRAEWHVTVAAVLALVMVAAVAWTAWLLCRPSEAPRPMWTVFVVVGAVATAAQVAPAYGHQRGGGVTILGWAVLAAGLATSISASTRWWAGPVAWLGVGAALGLMRAAYHVPGSAPGVAGWEFLGRAPVVLTREAVLVLLVSPAAGVFAQVTRRVVSPRAGPVRGGAW